ncbi:hypothetical protein [Oscillibacter sp.]|uniref:hypothetical protein n=1 Tax=Oscillibacter sp. TaxID=1945593 RepID=UPI0028AB56D9|nr:hypothetical protein [Oscillibacter sp.]
MLKQKRVLIPLALVAAVCLGTAVYLLIFRSAAALEPPEEYALGEDTVESLSSVLGLENSGELTNMETPDTVGANASSSAGSAADEAYYYTYQKLETGGESVRQYVERLTEEEDGFRIVDENGAVTDPPNYANTEGSVSLMKAASEDGWILRMDISWTAENCQITLTRPEGTVSTVETDPMTYVEAVDFFKSLAPSNLGLDAESLRDYSVCPMDGAVLVDGILCLKLQVYPPHEAGQANVIAGTYLLSGDKTHLYLLKDGAVRALPI